MILTVVLDAVFSSELHRFYRYPASWSLCYNCNSVEFFQHCTFMALNIRNPEAEQLASDLAALTGESKTEAVTKALKERLEQVKRLRRKRCIAERLDEIAKHCASLPLLDRRRPEDMLYDEQGLPR